MRSEIRPDDLTPDLKSDFDGSAFVKVLIFAFLAFSLHAHAAENTSADAQAIDSACTSDAATAGCTGEKVGTGLLKCIHAYHKAHKEFRPSKECHSAISKMRMDHHGAKAEKK